MKAQWKDTCLKEQFTKEGLCGLREAWGEDIIQILIVYRALPNNRQEKGMNWKFFLPIAWVSKDYGEAT